MACRWSALTIATTLDIDAPATSNFLSGTGLFSNTGTTTINCGGSLTAGLIDNSGTFDNNNQITRVASVIGETLLHS